MTEDRNVTTFCERLAWDMLSEALNAKPPRRKATKAQIEKREEYQRQWNKNNREKKKRNENAFYERLAGNEGVGASGELSAEAKKARSAYTRKYQQASRPAFIKRKIAYWEGKLKELEAAELKGTSKNPSETFL